MKWVPSTLILVALWGVLRMAGAELPLASAWSVFLVLLSIAAIIIEVFRSNNVSFKSMWSDLLFALIAFGGWVMGVTLILSGGHSFQFADALIGLAVICDAFVCTTLTMRISLRRLNVERAT